MGFKRSLCHCVCLSTLSPVLSQALAALPQSVPERQEKHSLLVSTFPPPFSSDLSLLFIASNASLVPSPPLPSLTSLLDSVLSSQYLRPFCSKLVVRERPYLAFSWRAGEGLLFHRSPSLSQKSFPNPRSINRGSPCAVLKQFVL